ncbi:AAA family ATPase [Actinomycetes bacterium KLBMP 9759]
MTDVARLGFGIALVGRRREMSALSAALERADAGRPTGVLLSGDAGVGKSRLVAEAIEQAAARGFTVLLGRCLDTAESSLPYLPFTEIVGTLAATRPDVVTERPALRHLLPGGHVHSSGRGDNRDLGQLQVFDAMLSALDALSTTAPVLLVVEDLHWADRSSRDLLTFLLSRLTAQRLVIMSTYRTDDLHRRHPLRGVLSELVRLPAVERIDLQRFPHAESVDFVRKLADGSLSESMVQRVAQRSEGNAFFAEELVSASSEHLPSGLADVLMARVEGLSACAQRVLRAASVAGRYVRHERLAAVLDMPEDELEQALREAVAHHVLVTEPAGAVDEYSFRHALLREAVYAELLPGERSRLHAAYTWLLAETTDDPGAAAELAYHALAAHDLPRALAASVAAAREANNREAPAEMLLHAEQALELWQAVPDAETVAGIDELDLTLLAAWAASATGDPDRGIALASRALELAEQRGDPVLSANIGRRYALRLLDLTGREQEALDVARTSLALIADRPPSADVAWSHAVLARTLGRIDRWQEAGVVAKKALEVAEAAPPDDLDVLAARADALISLAVVEELSGNAPRSRERLANAKALARRSGNFGVELRAHYNSGMSHLDAGELAAADEMFTVGEARAAANGITWSTYGLDLRVAHVITRFMCGEWDAAEESAELAGESVSATVAGRLAAAGLLLAVGRGRLEAAARRSAELRDLAPFDEQVIGLLGQTQAEAALWSGRPAEAARHIDDAIAGLNALYPYQIGTIMLAALGVAAHVDTALTGEVAPADAEKAAHALVEVAEATARHGAPRTGELGPEGRAWLLRARAELTRLGPGADPASWAAVIEAFGYEGRRSYRQAYGRLRRAEALLAVGEPHALVADDLRAAAATAEQLGAAPLAAAVAAMAERAGVRLDASPAPRATSAEQLTPRERAVLGLVAGGLTNRQVGAELFISEKTVSVHLSRVMAKLGAGSRTEAVSVAYARGLLAPADPQMARSDP